MKLAFTTLLIAVAVPASAQNPVDARQLAAQTQKLNPLDKVVCRTEETLGSRLGAHKVCATVREWQEQQQENRDALEKLQQQGQGVPVSG